KNNNGVTWNVGANASHSGSKVVFLPENVSEYYNAYTWNSGNIRNGIMVGQPIKTLTGRAYERNEAGQILISPTTGYPITSSVWSVIGDREPKLRFGFLTSLQYKAFRLSGVFSGLNNATVVNGTKRLMMARGASWESVSLRESLPVVFDGVLKDGNENTANPTVNNISVTYGADGSSIFSGGDEEWLEHGVNYLRLREVRLSYSVPNKVLSKSKLISEAVFYVVGNDLATWTNYSGIDAVGNTVSAAAGGVGGVGYDVWSIPNPRGITVGISVTFN
ncbi:MAG: SusC/RagA family TonB-linked outer membrane protein, partial [Niabella sp.]